MNLLRLLLAGASLLAATLHAQSSSPPLALGLTINDGTGAPLVRGWPVVIRADATLLENAAVLPVAGSPAPRLSILAASGTEVAWPLRRTDDPAAATPLREAGDAVRFGWVLPAAASAAIPPGAYRARVSWAGIPSPAVAFEVVEAPASSAPADEVRRALLASEVARLTGDPAAALEALAPVLAKQPDSILLLVERARACLQRGDVAGSLQASQRALELFEKAQPRSSHPPISILEVAFAAKEQLLRSVPGGPEISPAELRGPAKPATLTRAPASPSTGAVAPRPAPGTASVAVSAPAVAVSSGPPPGVVVPAGELDDATVRTDPVGQWASAAVAKSSYSNPNYGAARATGAPDVPIAGDSVNAWCPGVQAAGTDWLEVSFAVPARAVGVRVRQTNNPGAIAKVEAFEPDGTVHAWWEGTDPYVRPAVAGLAWFAVRVPSTSYAVARVKVTLDLARVAGWKQIDAVQLVTAP